jgi:hypothetical protein
MTVGENKAIFLEFIDELRRGNLRSLTRCKYLTLRFTRRTGQIGREESRARGN